MNSVVTGLVWSAREADGLSEDAWSNFPGVFGKIADVSRGAEPLLLWSDGQWTTFSSNWLEPFRQHDVTDFAHHLLQQLNPNFLSCCWESRLEEDGDIRVVDESAPRCPLHLYICGEQKKHVAAH